jgi:hypothetical protein
MHLSGGMGGYQHRGDQLGESGLSPGVEQSLTCVRFSWGKLVVEVFFVSWRRTTEKHKRRGFDIISPIH